MSGVVVLLYNLNNDKGRKIEKFCRSIALRPVYVSIEDYNKPIESILCTDRDNLNVGGKAAAKVSAGESTAINKDYSDSDDSVSEAFEDEMLVMCGFNSRLLDIFLKEYKKRHIEPVSLKAVLTEHNREWSSVQLHAELCRERAAFTKR